MIGKDTIMKKKSAKGNWKSWGVDDLIPESVLERMVALPDFDVMYVRKATNSHLKRTAWNQFSREFYRGLLKFQIETLSPDHATDDVFTLGGILEYAFIVKKWEKTLREQNRGILERP